MDQSADAQKLAAATGYWLSYSRHPERGLEVSTPKPTKQVSEFLVKQNRFKQLASSKPEIASALAQQLQEFINARYANYSSLAAKK